MEKPIYSTRPIYPEMPQKGAFKAYKLIDLYSNLSNKICIMVLELEVPANARRVELDRHWTPFIGLIRVDRAVPTRVLDHNGKQVHRQELRARHPYWGWEKEEFWPPIQYNDPYELGEMYYADWLCEDPKNPCSAGINCFLTLEETLSYWQGAWRSYWPPIAGEENYDYPEKDDEEEEEYYEEDEPENCENVGCNMCSENYCDCECHNVVEEDEEAEDDEEAYNV